MRGLATMLLGVGAACQPSPQSPERASAPAQPAARAVPAAPAKAEPAPRDRDVLSTRLDVDLETTRAHATIRLGPAPGAGASLEIGDLKIEKVEVDGVPTPFTAEEGRLDVDAPAAACELAIDYRFSVHDELEGYAKGVTLTWPYHCGNLFPCDSEPGDGTTFELSVHAPEGQTVVHPTRIDAQAPAYMLAWATGELERVDLGTTPKGRRVSIWSDREHLAETKKATATLPQTFDWLESTYGEYAFGDHVGTVIVDWGPGGLGGMEHHPFWHVSSADAGDVSVHVHEAAHGWYGNGVRIACWEDFVLSEGTVTYMATRAIEEVLGAEAGRERWRDHQARLDRLQASDRKKVAWPKGCNAIDILGDGLFGPAPYVKGAMFYRAVADQIGVDALDEILRDFHVAHRGDAARFDDMLAAIEKTSGYDARPCALAWLRADEVPADGTCAPPSR